MRDVSHQIEWVYVSSCALNVVQLCSNKIRGLMISFGYMGQQQKILLKLLILLLGFSYALMSLGAIPLSRSRTLMLAIEEQPVQDMMEQDVLMEHEELKEVGWIHGRMMENDDYPGTGANNHHDPPRTR
ncbi:hypothetical protein GIB67_037730 [Kingdonia uniflora]|uniref:Uncharacterized protein n=1 Tax=Kingdonia uniflora TaxID=39325 RepID=A0A7J7LV63_9MAGN|nr:hypothetical protein GIB67_037730 [Kingdonia uniflora]